MQRSFPYQDIVNKLFLIVLFIGYISLSSIYLLMPPLLAILFYAYNNALSRHNLFELSVISMMLLIFEAEKGFGFGSTILFFTLVSRYLIPKIEQAIQCRICMAAVFVLSAYPGYWAFTWIINQVLLFQLPAIDWHIGLYMLVEFLVIAALV